MKRMHRVINHRIETIFIEIIILILNKMFEITIRNTTDKNQNYMNKKLTVKLPKMQECKLVFVFLIYAGHVRTYCPFVVLVGLQPSLFHFTCPTWRVRK